jgi:HAD superfamily hydrolase (TIGR01458 family)
MPTLRGLLLDLDGTLNVGDSLVEGAAGAIEALRRRGIPFSFATNTTRLSRRLLRERIARMGIDVPEAMVHTAPRAAAGWLASQGHRRVLPLLCPDAFEDLDAFDLVDPESGAPVDAVLVGDLGDAWSYRLLNHAFRRIMDGAALVAINRNRYWRTEDGLSLDAGPFVAALEHAAGVSATVVGKPSRSFYESALSALGLAAGEVAMVGDDLEGDVAGAQRHGLLGILVRTGKFREADLGKGVRPDRVLDSIAEILSLFD